MKIHESRDANGTLVEVQLSVAASVVSITTERGELPLASGALEAVMKKFGGPLEASEKVVEIDRLELGGGRVLRHVRHLARYDVIARDFLVYASASPDEDALCALAVTVSAALTHLARASAARTAVQDSSR